MNESTEVAPLESEIRRRIAAAGAMPVSQFMALCLTDQQHGYYATRQPFGAEGDYVTAPEISQMFGELIGLWAGAVWRRMGSPASVRLVELGPGRGTMMLDALRAAKVMPEFRSAIMCHLVEISAVLEEQQRQAFAGLNVPVSWHRTFEEVPDGPLIVLANEFFDSLPVHQAVMCADGWHERVVKVDEEGNLRFSVARDPIPPFELLLPQHLRRARIGEVFEWRVDRYAFAIARRVVKSHGAALVVDYGHTESGIGDTLQAVSAHDFVDPLIAPGLVDLTAHVDFQALAQAFETMGARVHGPIEQGELLRRLGIETRAAALKASLPKEKAGAIDEALVRLTAREAEGMGGLFKAVAIADPEIGSLPGFEAQ
jgi:SAM-dependent MidA family methyltransferase